MPDFGTMVQRLAYDFMECLLENRHSDARGGHAQLFFRSAIAIPQLEGSTSAIAILQIFKECWSAAAIPQFRNHVFVI